MIHSFKLYGQRYALDLESGAVHLISEIHGDMLKYLNLPFESIFPSSLRYDLAKYESSKLKEAYFEYAKWNEDGVFMSNTPKKLPMIEPENRNPDETVTFSGTKFVFASEVIRLADSGLKLINATEDTTAPVKECDYDIVESEYERIAKEIIKRRSGRSPFPVFDFLPFELPFAKDENGYSHITYDGFMTAFGENGTSVQKKIVECAIAVYFSK